jgi:hypothetical protein
MNRGDLTSAGTTNKILQSSKYPITDTQDRLSIEDEDNLSAIRPPKVGGRQARVTSTGRI